MNGSTQRRKAKVWEIAEPQPGPGRPARRGDPGRPPGPGGQGGNWFWPALVAIVLMVITGSYLRPRAPQPALPGPAVAAMPMAAPLAGPVDSAQEAPAAPAEARAIEATLTAEVLGTWPREGARGQSRQAPIEISFSQQVPRDVVEANLSLSPNVPGTLVSGSPTRFSFRPAQRFAPGTTYTVSVRPAEYLLAGQAVRLPGAQWAFATGGPYSYRREVRPLIEAHCQGCHGTSGSANRIPLGSYAALLPKIRPGSSSTSPLLLSLAKPSHQVSLSDRDRSTRENLEVIRDWIDLDLAAE